MSWASRRQLIYLMGFLVVVAGILFLLFFPVFYKAPTCTDNKQNADELGVDCGGSMCRNYCSFQEAKPLVLWSRTFHIVGSDYNLLAYIENSNKTAAVYQAPYEFRVYDTTGKLIGRREGVTFIPPNQRFAVFEARFDVGTANIKNTTFEFTGPLIWTKKSPTIQTLPIRVDNINMGTDMTSPTLSAQVNNDSIYDIPAFDVVTILYDSMHNAIAVSKTTIDGLPSNTSVPVVFTWPLPFSDTPVTKDILPQINPFLMNF